jgi:hypothetical protein
MVCCFQLTENKLNPHVIQLAGKYGIFLGKLDNPDPSILILNNDMKSILVVSLDQGQLESKLPHGEVSLGNKVIGLFWTPLREGLAILYELAEDNILAFSQNRLMKHDLGDFEVLINRSYGLKLSNDERVYDVKWTSFIDATTQPKAVVATSHRVLVVDDKLNVLSQLKMQEITGVRWLGDHTILLTTEKNLRYITCGRLATSGVIVSFDGSAKTTLINALSDRLILANPHIKGSAVSLLEPLLLGYLHSVSSYKLDVELVSNCLRYLDTNMIS